MQNRGKTFGARIPNLAPNQRETRARDRKEKSNCSGGSDEGGVPCPVPFLCRIMGNMGTQTNQNKPNTLGRLGSQTRLGRKEPQQEVHAATSGGYATHQVPFAEVAAFLLILCSTWPPSKRGLGWPQPFRHSAVPNTQAVAQFQAHSLFILPGQRLGAAPSLCLFALIKKKAIN
jgi:hypothetical protein